MELEVPKLHRIIDEELLAKMRRRPCDACGKLSTKDNPNYACHIKTRGSFGDDVFENLYTGCLLCHDLQGKSWYKIFEKYPFFKQYIYSKGWDLNSFKQLRRSEHKSGFREKVFGKL